MKLALVNTDEESNDAPFGLCYIAAYLRKYLNFYDTVIIDKEDTMKRIKQEKPDLVGITASSIYFSKANAWAGQIKSQFDIPVMVGGVHITSLPNQFEKSNFDIAVIGEGEQTAAEIVQKFEKPGFKMADLKDVKGLVFKDGDKIEHTGHREFITPLDNIPYPARDLLNMDNYTVPRASVFRGELTVALGLLTSRGCPYKCTFCASKFWERVMRLHSADYVVGEVRELVEKYKVDHIIVWDDLFIVNKKRIEELHAKIRAENLHEKVTFIANGRVNTLDEDVCRMLKEMNVKTVSFGFESGSPDVLKYLKQGSTNVDQNKKAVEICNRYGINVNGFFVMGAPMETEKDMQMTMDFIKNYKIDSFSVFQLVPFPGTQVWDYAKSKGIVNEDMTDFSFAQLVRPEFKPDIVMNENMDKETLKKWYFAFLEEAEKRNYRKFKFKWRYMKYLVSPRFIRRVASKRKDIPKYLKWGR